MFLPFILLSLGVGAAAVKVASKSSPTMTPYRRMVFQNVLCKDPPFTPDQILAYAAAFDAEGLSAEADILRRRARIAGLSPVEKQKLAWAFQRGMSSKDPVSVRVLANAFEAEALLDSAAKLRDYANGLDVAAQIAEAEPTAPPAPPSKQPVPSPATSDPHEPTGSTTPIAATQESPAPVEPVATSARAGDAVTSSPSIPSPATGDVPIATQ
jgi:hypothetical protein